MDSSVAHPCQQVPACFQAPCLKHKSTSDMLLHSGKKGFGTYASLLPANKDALEKHAKTVLCALHKALL